VTPEEKVACSVAMGKLGIAKRDRVDQAVFNVYLENSALSHFGADVITATCARLEADASVEWFPKLHDLIAQCDRTAMARIRADQARLALPPAPMPEPDPERLNDFMRAIRALANLKRMTK